MSGIPLVAVVSTLAVAKEEQLQQVKVWLCEQAAKSQRAAALVIDHNVVPVPEGSCADSQTAWLEVEALEFLRRNTESYQPDYKAIQQALSLSQGKGLLVRQAFGNLDNLLKMQEVMRELLYACANPPTIIAFEVAPKDLTALSFSVEEMIQLNPRRLTSAELKNWMKIMEGRVFVSWLKIMAPAWIYLPLSGARRFAGRLKAIIRNR